MMRFEDLDVWKRAARLSADIYRQLRELKDYGFKDQITRSGLSVPSNIAEGFERESQKVRYEFSFICKRILWGAKMSDLYRHGYRIYSQRCWEEVD